MGREKFSMSRLVKKSGSFLESKSSSVLFVLALIFSLLALYGAYTDALCCDEHIYLNVTYNYFHTFDRIGLRDTPYLLHIINVVPVMLTDEVGYHENKDVVSAMADSSVDFRWLLILVRVPSILLGIVLLYYIYAFGSRMFSRTAGILAALFFVIDGNLSAHYHIVSCDATLAAFMFISMYYFWIYLKDPKMSTFAFFILFSSLTLISKISGFYLFIILILLLPVIFLSDEFRPVLPWNIRPKEKNNGFNKVTKQRFDKGDNGYDTPQKYRLRNKFFSYLALIALSTLILFVILSLVYFGFSTLQDMVPSGMEGRAEYKLSTVGQQYPLLNGTIQYIYHNVPLPMPAYIKTFGQQLAHSYEPQDIYLNGEYSPSGFRTYFISLFLVKMPTVIIFMTFLFVLLFLLRYRTIARKHDYWYLIVPILLILFMVSFNHVQYGFKYLYPALPFLYVLLASSVVLIGSASFSKPFSMRKDAKARNAFSRQFSLYATFIILLLLLMSSVELALNVGNIFAYQNIVSRAHPLDSYCIDGCLDWFENGYRIVDYLDKGVRAGAISPETSIYLDQRYYERVASYIRITKKNSALLTMLQPLDLDSRVSQGDLVIISKTTYNCYELPKPCFSWLKDDAFIFKGKVTKSLDVYERI